MRYWGKIKIEDIICKDITINSHDFKSAVSGICYKFDLSKPVILNKHINEMALFNRTVFSPDDFIESVSFDSFEIEKIVNRKKAKA